LFQLGEGEQQDGFRRTVLAMMETHAAEATKEAEVGSLLLHLLYHQSSAKASAASSKASAVSSGHPSSAASSSSSSSSDHANEASKARERSPDLVEEEVDESMVEEVVEDQIGVSSQVCLISFCFGCFSVRKVLEVVSASFWGDEMEIFDFFSFWDQI
jgi:hypothetical protein